MDFSFSFSGLNLHATITFPAECGVSLLEDDERDLVELVFSDIFAVLVSSSFLLDIFMFKIYNMVDFQFQILQLTP
jgi:hypothetical protein